MLLLETASGRISEMTRRQYSFMLLLLLLLQIANSFWFEEICRVDRGQVCPLAPRQPQDKYDVVVLVRSDAGSSLLNSWMARRGQRICPLIHYKDPKSKIQKNPFVGFG